jgi:hypothetical protein
MTEAEMIEAWREALQEATARLRVFVEENKRRRMTRYHNALCEPEWDVFQ